MDRRTPTPQTTPAGNPPIDSGACPQPCPRAATEEGPNVKLGAAFVQTVRHFFPRLNDWLQELPDSRVQDLCQYETRFLAWWGLLLFVLQLGSRRQLDFQLDACGTHVLDNVNRLADTQQPTRPTQGTLDHFIGHSTPQGFATLRDRLNRQLLRSKVFDPARLLGYRVVPLDATGLYTFRQRHCEHCLTSQHGEVTTYAHNVLEAKLLGPGDLVLSLASEFIDNKGLDLRPNSSAQEVKQDCELKAFSRLAPALHAAFPQLRLCLTVDALYACGRFFAVCQQYGWAYVITFKPGNMKTAWNDFQGLLALVPEQRVERILPDGTRRVYRWVNNLSYRDDEGRLWTFDALDCQETALDGTARTAAWLTCLPVNRNTVASIAQEGGRGRWKIENEGFNRQKNSDLNLHHLYSTDPEKLKAYYYLLQIACILLQLWEQGSLLRRLAAEFGSLPRRLWGSLKNVAARLLESLRGHAWAEACFDVAAAGRLRIGMASFSSA
jgi:hypothetical protein